MAVTPENFLQKDYELKIKYLTDHLQRMWTRFNFFVTIESALIGGKLLSASSTPGWALPAAGMGLSLLWYIMGAQDRYLVSIYRWQVKQAAKRLANVFTAPIGAEKAALNSFNEAQAAAADYVGRLDDDLISRFENEENKQIGTKDWLNRSLEKLSSWRSERFTITHLAAFYPLAVLGLWVILLIISLF